MVVDGEHGFDQNMKYNMKFDVPAKYLGGEVAKLLASVNMDASKINVPVTANITGNFANPKIGTDLKQAITTLTTQLIKDQKTQLLNKGAVKLAKMAGIKNADSIKKLIPTTKEEIKEKVKEKVQEKAEEQIKEKAGNALKGLFGR